MNKSWDEFLVERLRVVRELDIEAFKRTYPRDLLGKPMSDEIALMALHKSRVEVTTMPKVLRLESIEWLRAHGVSRMRGLPLPAPGVLPE